MSASQVLSHLILTTIPCDEKLMFREESNQLKNTQGVISCRVRTEGSWSPRTKPCQLRTWPCVITIELPPFHQSSFKEHPTWYTIPPPSWIRISKACNLFFSSSGRCFAQASGFSCWSLCNSREGQRQIKFNPILWETPHPYEHHSPVTYMYIYVCAHQTHTSRYAHLCTYVCPRMPSMSHTLSQTLSSQFSHQPCR